jgi:hypothetical protein
MDPWVPELTLSEGYGRCRLALSGLTHGDGRTLQEAADDLVARILRMAVALRSGALAFTSEIPPPDSRVIGFLHEVAGQAGDADGIRRRILLGLPPR